MQRLADQDQLTALRNRRAFNDRLTELTEHEPPRGAILMIDIDKFTSITDTHGHRAGDETLIAVARVISTSIRADDFAARVGGDEFIVLLPATGSVDADAIAERIRMAVLERSASPALTVSIGISELSSDTRQARDAADRALYLAKQSGGNTLARADDVAAE
jgi:diguanylate cyclase (GGDEF)-like protein